MWDYVSACMTVLFWRLEDSVTLLATSSEMLHSKSTTCKEKTTNTSQSAGRSTSCLFLTQQAVIVLSFQCISWKSSHFHGRWFLKIISWKWVLILESCSHRLWLCTANKTPFWTRLDLALFSLFSHTIEYKCSHHENTCLPYVRAELRSTWHFHVLSGISTTCSASLQEHADG